MKNITLYFTFLITTALPQTLLAQKESADDISWNIAAQIAPPHQQSKSIGLAGAAIGVTDQKIVIAGGTNFPDKMPWNGGKKRYYSDVFIYAKNGNSLLQQNADTHFKLPFKIAYGAVCTTPNGVVIAGGENEDGLSNMVLLLNLKDEKLVITYLPALPKGLTNASLTLNGDKLYLAGGEIESGAVNQFLSLNLKKQDEGWVLLPHLPNEVSHAVLLSADDEIYLLSGRKRNVGDTSTIYKGMYSFNLKQQEWEIKKSLPYPLSAATGIVKEKCIFIFSGDKGETFHKAERLIAAVDKEKDAVKKESLNQQKIELQSNHPGFSKIVLKYNLTTGLWTELKTSMPYGTVTTNAVVLNNEVIIAGGEIKAGVRTPDIAIGKLKKSK